MTEELLEILFTGPIQGGSSKLNAEPKVRGNNNASKDTFNYDFGFEIILVDLVSGFNFNRSQETLHSLKTS